MPQLASGELGWAVDAQELYIGNGSVAEGAPAVGNTRLLTENDFGNVLDFAKLYAYKPDNVQTGFTPGSKVFRSLQERLDEHVSVRAFGAVGDGLTDDTAAIQRAIDQLFLSGSGDSADESRRAILYFPPGIYMITDTLHLPPYATLLGSGKNNTIIRSADTSVFDTVTSNSVSGAYDYSLSINTNLTPPVVNTNPLPKFITVRDMTIESLGDAPAVFLRNCFNSLFENLLIIGGWSFIVNTAISTQTGITISADYLDVSANNRFVNVDIEGFTYGIYSDYDIKNNMFTDGSIRNCMYGVVFGEGTAMIPELEGYMPVYGPHFNTIKNTVFDRISRHGIKVVVGQYNSSEGNKFFNVGNDQGEYYLAVFPAISYATDTNTSSNDFFERSTLIYNATTDLNTDYIPEVSGRIRLENNTVNQLSIMENTVGSNTSADVIKLPVVENGKVFVDYTLTGQYVADGNFSRSGVIEIFVDNESNILINDSYEYTGSNLFAGQFVFEAEFRDYGPQPSFAEYQQYRSLVLKVSEIPALTNDNFSYTIRIKS
jgi:hypothetical protein